MAVASICFEPVSAANSLGPWLTAAHRQHGVQSRAGFFVAIDRAAVQRIVTAGDLRQRTVELELENISQEVARVRDICGDMIFRSGIKILLAASNRGRDALILAAQIPPALTVVSRSYFAGEDFPTPLIDHKSER